MSGCVQDLPAIFVNCSAVVETVSLDAQTIHISQSFGKSIGCISRRQRLHGKIDVEFPASYPQGAVGVA